MGMLSYMSSSGDMKMSLKLMTSYSLAYSLGEKVTFSYILMTKVFEEFQLSVCSLGEDWGAERLHDLLDGHSLAGQLVFGRTG